MLKRFITLFMAVMAVAIHADYLDEGFAAPPMRRAAHGRLLAFRSL